MSSIRVQVTVVLFILAGFLVTVPVGYTREADAAQTARVLLDFQVNGPEVKHEVRHSVRA